MGGARRSPPIYTYWSAIDLTTFKNTPSSLYTAIPTGLSSVYLNSGATVVNSSNAAEVGGINPEASASTHPASHDGGHR